MKNSLLIPIILISLGTNCQAVSRIFKFWNTTKKTVYLELNLGKGKAPQFEMVTPGNSLIQMCDENAVTLTFAVPEYASHFNLPFQEKVKAELEANPKIQYQFAAGNKNILVQLIQKTPKGKQPSIESYQLIPATFFTAGFDLITWKNRIKNADLNKVIIQSSGKQSMPEK